MASDYYETLGVARSATKDEIRAAYRRLARQFHPDVNKAPEAETRFKEINEAHEVLSDDDKRARYDRYGAAGVSGMGGMGGAGIDIQDLMDQFFEMQGMGGRRRGPRRGGDRRVEAFVTFEEAVFGVQKEIKYERLMVCESCTGSGAEPGTSASACPQCRGSGEVRQQRATPFGVMAASAPCPKCSGRGEVINTPCKTCGGAGRMRKTQSLQVNIPAGIGDGNQLPLYGRGDDGERGASPGALFVEIRVKDHAYFKRNNDDIILDITINVAQAALGDKISVPTVDGNIDLTIQPGTQTGKSSRVRGKGFPRLLPDGTNNGRGDQIVYIQVQTPTNLTDEQKRLFQELARTLGTGTTNHSHSGRGFFDRMMNFFNGEQ
jgi:molecular chaperone DnaJ